MHKIAVDVTFTQITAKRGIKMHGEQAIASMYKQYINLDYMRVLGAMSPESLIKSQNWGNTYNILDKRKNCVKLKGRAFADGIPQRC